MSHHRSTSQLRRRRQLRVDLTTFALFVGAFSLLGAVVGVAR